MVYRENKKNGDNLSQLGFGCMRFPRNMAKIDQEKTNKLIAMATDLGINYFDTAYIYPGSEEALGQALASDGRRSQINIATKLPHSFCKENEDFDKVFNTQLKRLNTDWVDYYLIHMLSSPESWQHLESLGIVRWIENKREEGKIRNIGFSYHGGRSAFLSLLDVYDWDFCMVQYNYFDEYNQAGAGGVKEAYKRGLPVFAMEPLRGGMLADKMPENAKRVLLGADGNRSTAEWALRWLYNQPEVTMALSGMSTTEQLKENSAIASTAETGCLSDAELSAYKDAVDALKGLVKIPCTACGYCIPCPKGVDIPTCFSSYNESYSQGLISAISQYVQVTGLTGLTHTDASNCISCGKCLPLCPQGIEIIDELKKVRRRMKTGAIKAVMKAAGKVMRIR